MNAKYAFIGIQELDKLLLLNGRDDRAWCPLVRAQGTGAFYFRGHLVLVLELLGPSLLAYMKTLPRGRVPVQQLRKIALQLVKPTATQQQQHRGTVSHASRVYSLSFRECDRIDCRCWV